MTAVLLFIPAPMPAQTAESMREVAYVDDPHPEQKLDFYWPRGAASAMVLFIHGGGLRERAERRSSPRYRKVCEPFVDAGIACATSARY